MDDAGKESLRASKVCKVGVASCILGVVSCIGTFANLLIAVVVGLTDSTPNIIFVGLTAYDTQKIKNMYMAYDSGEVAAKKAIMGALTLYLDFINLFIMLLRLFGQRR